MEYPLQQLSILSLYQTVLLFIVLSLVLICGAILLYENLEVAEREVVNFIDYYKKSPAWWISSLFATIIGLSIGAGFGPIIDIVVLSIFLSPAAIYFVRDYPFSISCEYRAFNDETGQTSIHEEEKKLSEPVDEGLHEVELYITTGSNVEEYELQIDAPRTASIEAIQTADDRISLTEEDNIVGETIPESQRSVVTLTIETDLGSQSKPLVVRDDDSKRVLEIVHLLPDD